jgi:hypothetical protein
MIHQLRIYEIFEHNKAAFHERFRDHGDQLSAGAPPSVRVAHRRAVSVIPNASLSKGAALLRRECVHCAWHHGGVDWIKEEYMKGLSRHHNCLCI